MRVYIGGGGVIGCFVSEQDKDKVVLFLKKLSCF